MDPTLHLSPALARRLRRAVLDLKDDPRRTRFSTIVHVADATRTLERPAADAGCDLGMRTDVMTAMLAQLDAGAHLGTAAEPRWAAWISRPGRVDPHDVDFDWCLASRQAGLALDRPVEFFVVTRGGWRHPASGAVRTWTRLRRRAAA